MKLQFRLIKSDDIPVLNILLNDLSDYYDGHLESKFIDQLTKSSELNHDYLTIRKEIWCAVNEKDSPVGFICLNFKLGKSVKLGPILVVKEFRNNGIGKYLIESSASLLKRGNFRKIYATTSKSNIAACKLIASQGFIIESELPNQYKQGSTEIVWGKFLKKNTSSIIAHKSIVEESNEDSLGSEVSNFNQANDLSYLSQAVKAIESWHSDIDDKFVNKLAAGTKIGWDYEKKGNMIFCSKYRNKTNGIIVLSPKRGGAIKMYPLLGSQEALKILLKKAGDISKEKKFNKIYTFAYVGDHEYQQILDTNQYVNRGKLLSPYKTGYDLFVYDLALS